MILLEKKIIPFKISSKRNFFIKRKKKTKKNTKRIS